MYWLAPLSCCCLTTATAARSQRKTELCYVLVCASLVLLLCKRYCCTTPGIVTGSFACPLLLLLLYLHVHVVYADAADQTAQTIPAQCAPTHQQLQAQACHCRKAVQVVHQQHGG